MSQIPTRVDGIVSDVGLAAQRRCTLWGVNKVLREEILLKPTLIMWTQGCAVQIHIIGRWITTPPCAPRPLPLCQWIPCSRICSEPLYTAERASPEQSLVGHIEDRALSSIEIRTEWKDLVPCTIEPLYSCTLFGHHCYCIRAAWRTASGKEKLRLKLLCESKWLVLQYLFIYWIRYIR